MMRMKTILTNKMAAKKIFKIIDINKISGKIMKIKLITKMIHVKKFFTNNKKLNIV